MNFNLLFKHSNKAVVMKATSFMIKDMEKGSFTI